jgi:hypothetical protein
LVEGIVGKVVSEAWVNGLVYDNIVAGFKSKVRLVSELAFGIGARLMGITPYWRCGHGRMLWERKV